MITKKEIRMHIYSIFALILVISSFFILGGGGSSDKVMKSDDGFVNVSIPDARDENLAENRFDASQREENRSQEVDRVEKLQQNSFELFRTDSADSPDVSSQKLSFSSSGNTAPVNKISKSGGVEEGAIQKSKGKEIVTRRVMKRKREQIERELGINLSDYGYDKYKDEEETAENTVNEEELFSATSSEKSGFYGLDAEEDSFSGDIKAVIHGNHTDVRSGSIIKMRILEDVLIDGVKVPLNTFIYGKLSFRNGRAAISVSNINYRNRILNFSGSIYDNDGFEGLYVPDNVLSDTKNKVTSDVIGSVDIDVSSKSKLLRSASSAVTNTIKNAVQGSIRDAKISISSNYLITIKRTKK